MVPGFLPEPAYALLGAVAPRERTPERERERGEAMAPFSVVTEPDGWISAPEALLKPSSFPLFSLVFIRDFLR